MPTRRHFLQATTASVAATPFGLGLRDRIPHLLVAVGGGALRAVRYAVEGLVPTPHSLAVDGCDLDLDKTVIPAHLRRGERPRPRLGAGGGQAVGRRMAEAASQEIASRVGRADIVLLVACMGGGIGGGAAPVIARVARETGSLVIAVPLLPFRAEGEVRVARAKAAQRALAAAADATLPLPYDELYPFERRSTERPAWPSLDVALSDVVCALCWRVRDAREQSGHRPTLEAVMHPPILG